MCSDYTSTRYIIWKIESISLLLAPRFVDLLNVTLSLQIFINENLKPLRPIRVIYVAGLDLFNRCRGMEPLRAHHMGGVAVVYRQGESHCLLTSTAIQNDSKVFHVSHNDEDSMDTSTTETEDISSTLIRKRLKINDVCEHLTYKSVLDYLKLNKLLGCA